jgi:hypothetical protein
MPLKQLDAPCWVIACPDGTLAGQWDERHFSDEDEAADVLDCEAASERGDLAPRELAAPCLTIVCDGCGEPHKAEPGAYLIDHFTGVVDAWAGASGIEFRRDGTTWCEDCRSSQED